MSLGFSLTRKSGKDKLHAKTENLRSPSRRPLDGQSLAKRWNPPRWSGWPRRRSRKPRKMSRKPLGRIHEGSRRSRRPRRLEEAERKAEAAKEAARTRAKKAEKKFKEAKETGKLTMEEYNSPEKWDLVAVYKGKNGTQRKNIPKAVCTQPHLLQRSGGKSRTCDAEGCGATAVAVWKGRETPGEWNTCVPCQENEFGGSPMYEMESTPLKAKVANVEKRVTKISNNNLQFAVKLWCRNRSAAEVKYGRISGWDTSKVTSMEGLFASNCSLMRTSQGLT